MSIPACGLDDREWDKYVLERGGHLLQTSRWAELKRAFGWDYEIVAVGSGSEITAGALVLLRRLPLGLGTVAYVPRGPVVDWEDRVGLSSLMAALDHAAYQHRAILLKLEPDESDTPALREQLSGLNFRLSIHQVQPPRTILIDIGGTEEDILACMNQGTRRKIRLAAKRGVTVRFGDSNDLFAFNRLMALTGERDAFGVHSPAYYEKVYELFAPQGGSAQRKQACVALLMASYEGKDLGGLMVFALGKKAWYLYGASSDEERQRMPNHALQWEAIRWARQQGCTTYDMWGIPDEDEEVLEAQFQTRHDGLWGVYGFKRGFGGQVVRMVGAWDRVYRPVRYAAYKMAATRGAVTG